MTESPPNAPTVVIPLNDDHLAIIDAADQALARGFVWKAYRRHRSWYAGCRIRKGTQTRIVWLHRLIAATPFGLICHHRNRNSLDDRRANLLNMACRQHQLLHYNNTLLVKTDGSFVDLC